MAGRRPVYAPKVTGLSPKEGPPGTKVTVRGEYLGTSPDDLIGLTIFGYDCLLYSEWMSPSKILTRSPKFKGVGDVIVATRSGGIGSCTVQFRGYEEVVTMTKESAIWVNEEELNNVGTVSRHRSASSPSLMPADPLGLQPEDSEERIPDDEEVMAGGNGAGSILITSEDFSPSRYLVQKHRRATFDQLKAGLLYLKQNMEGGGDPFGANTSPLALLKPNVLAVVECLDALKSVHMALKKDKNEFGQDLTHKMEDAIKRATDDAHEIFDGILARKDMSDSTRNALNVLQRYRFLFNLPSSIERNIQRGDYDAVINDYNRGRSLFEDTQVKVFRRVYSEVEQRITKFKKVLQEKRKTICCRTDSRNLDELKKIIRYLVDLRVDFNPAWDSLLLMRDTLRKNMNACRDKHSSISEARSHEKTAGNSDDYSTETPQSVLYIEELISIFNQFYPDLIKLGHEYLNKSLFSRETDDDMKTKELIFENEMNHDLIKSLVDLLRYALLPSQPSSTSSSSNPSDKGFWKTEKKEMMAIWLPHSLRCIIECYQNLQELSPNSLQPIQQLIFDFRVHSMVYLLNQWSEEIRGLDSKENWDVMLDNTTGTRTQLPLLFESKVIEILSLIRETIIQTSAGSDEVDILSQINVKGQIKQLAQNLLSAFVSALEKTLSQTDVKCIYSYDERLLLVICNCTYTTNHVLPRINEAFDRHNYPDMSMVLKVMQAKSRDLENKLLKQYTERKCDFVSGSIEPAMYFQSQEWFAPSNRPSDVSFYIKDTIMNLIQVQSQIFSVSPGLVRKIMVDVIDAAVEEMARLHECVAHTFNDYGNLQAVIDFSALKVAFRDIDSNSTEKLIESSTHHLKPVRSQDKDIIEKVLHQLKLSMHLQLYSFRWESDQNTLIVI